MKRWFLYIVGVCLLAFVCFACTDEMEANGSSKERSVKLQLQLSLPIDASARTTRMTSGFEAGSKYENYINFDDESSYRIYFFDTENQYIARFTPSKTVMTEATNYTLYSVEGEIPEAVLQRAANNAMDFKIVVLTNWKSYEEPKAGDALGTICNADWAQFEILKSFELSEKNLIPFYGVNEYTDVPVQYGGTITLKESIPLLRAMAKVEVILDTSDKSGDFSTDVSFSDVWVCRYNTQGYCAPKADWQGNDYPTSLHLINDKNDPENTSNAEGRKLRFLRVNERSDTENEKWIAYLPEYDNSGTDYSYIEVTLDSQIDTSYKIYFSKSGDGVTKPFFDIARNNLYRFNVRIRNGKIMVEVNEWDHTYDNDYTIE